MSKLGTERVNHCAGDMIGKGRDIASRLGDLKNISNGHKQLQAKARAKRALKVIEAVKARTRRWR